MKNKNTQKLGDSQSVTKVLNRVRKTLGTERFEAQVADIRASLGIPAEGWPMTDQDKLHLGDMLYVPEHAPDETNFLKRANLLVAPLMDQLPANSIFLRQATKGYVYYNTLEIDAVAEQMFLYEKTGRHELIDLRLELEERFGGGDIDPSIAVEYVAMLTRRSKQYPVLLGFSPDAGKIDFEFYFERNWERIEATLKKYPVALAKKVKNDKLSFNEEKVKVAIFLHKHRHLSLVEAKNLLKEKLGVVRSYEEIGKIRSLEKKRQATK